MSTFNTFSNEKKFLNSVIRNIGVINALYITGIFILYLFILFFDDLEMGYKRATLIITPGVILLIAGWIFNRKIMKNLKPTGKLTLTQTTIQMEDSNNSRYIHKEEIKKIIVAKKLTPYYHWNRDHFAIIDIAIQDESLKNIFVSHFDQNNKFEIINSLRIFSKINRIPLEMKKENLFF